MSNIRELGSYQKWEKASRKNPLFVLSLRWIPTGKTLGETLRDIGGSPAVSSNKKSTRALETALDKICGRVGSDVQELLVEMISDWKIEKIPEQALNRELTALFSEGTQMLETLVAGELEGIYFDTDVLEEEGIEFQTRLARGIESRLALPGFMGVDSPETEQTT